LLPQFGDHLTCVGALYWLGLLIPLEPPPLQERVKEYGGAVDWRIICSYVVVVELLLSRVNVSCEVVLKRGEVYANLALRKVICSKKLARWRCNIALR
jgi:hypothetical protein